MSSRPALEARPLLAILAAATCLSGCISLLPTEKPARLFRFDAGAVAGAQATPAGKPFLVRAAPLSFQRGAAGDRILTVSGDEAAYIGGSRWVTSAESLFEAALTQAFDRAQGPARLIAPGEPSAPDYTLKVDVRTFEVRYDHGPGGRPTVVVEVYGALVARGDPATDRRRLFRAEAPASANSVRAIAAAFDVAVGKVLAELVGWVGARGV